MVEQAFCPHKAGKMRTSRKQGSKPSLARARKSVKPFDAHMLGRHDRRMRTVAEAESRD
jgi:hypothetical protein